MRHAVQSTLRSLAAEVRQAGRSTGNAIEAKEAASARVHAARTEHEMAQRRLQEPPVSPAFCLRQLLPLVQIWQDSVMACHASCAQTLQAWQRAF